MPTDIEDTRNIIESLKAQYPDKGVMIVKPATSGLPAGTTMPITSSTLPSGYSPASPENQREWLIDLTTAVAYSRWRRWCTGNQPGSQPLPNGMVGVRTMKMLLLTSENNLLLPGEDRVDGTRLQYVSTREATPMEDQIRITMG